MEGFIYVLSNSLVPGIVKVGCSHDPDQRADELSSTSIPGRFVVNGTWAVPDMHAAEATVHKSLHWCRLDNEREFFTLPVVKAVELISTIVDCNHSFRLVKPDPEATFVRVASAVDFGDTVRRVRKRLGLTQEQLSGAANTGLRFIIDLENGKGTMQFDKALAVAQALGLHTKLTERE